MAIMKIDGWDVFPYSRVSPGEGMELTDPDLVDPRFTDSTLGEGQPLVNFSINNREIIIPVHFSPKFSLGSYADTRTGLNSLIVDANRACQTAQRFEWKDDAAATSTYFNVEFARFEPEYNYRRVQNRILSGNVHLWTLPYGDTNTERVVASAIATGIVLQTPIASVSGDAPANLNIFTTIGGTSPISGFMREGRIVGYTLVPSGYTVDHPAPSLRAGVSPTLRGSAEAVGSQYIQCFDDMHSTTYAGLRLLSASQYAGKLRLFAVMRVEDSEKFEIPVNAYLNGVPFSRSNCMASLNGAVKGWGTIDLGVCNVNPLEGATAYIDIRGSVNTTDLTGRATQAININRLVTVPEDNFTIITDFNRSAIARISASTVNSITSSTSAIIDQLGNTITNGSRIATVPVYGDKNNGFARFNWASGYHTAGFVVEHDLKTEMRISLGGVGMYPSPLVNPSLAVFIGRIAPASAVSGATGAFLKFFSNATQHYINLFATPFGLRASAGIAQLSGASHVYLEYSIQGSKAYGILRSGSQVATVVDTLDQYYTDVGQAFYLQTATAFESFYELGHWMTVTENPSRALTLGDQYHWTASTVTKSASVGLARLEMSARGAPLQAQPGKYQDIAVFNLPLDGEATTDFLSVDCRISERFTFSR